MKISFSTEEKRKHKTSLHELMMITQQLAFY
jgi:hypothetical protein